MKRHMQWIKDIAYDVKVLLTASHHMYRTEAWIVAAIAFVLGAVIF